MNDCVLYRNERASPESFDQALRAFVSAGYKILSAPARNRDGYGARLKKAEEVWLEWYDTDALIVSAIQPTSESLKSEVATILGSAGWREVKVV